MAESGPSYSRSGGPGRPQEYVAVPRVPFSPPRSRTPASPPIKRNASGGHRVLHRAQHSNPLSVPPKPTPPISRNRTAEDVQMHNLGGGFGPYAVSFSACLIFERRPTWQLHACMHPADFFTIFCSILNRILNNQLPHEVQYINTLEVEVPSLYLQIVPSLLPNLIRLQRQRPPPPPRQYGIKKTISIHCMIPTR